ncbi:MAG: LysM peptidoglycan-binding domain-containing protein, partial [Gammaproteobacteria bacterium]|nr:LysM peptidoglycan-binding domain-containing protein [Gammaproteobacteria bacterium]
LSEIAMRFHVTTDELRDFNRLASDDFIRIGQTLKIPTRG